VSFHISCFALPYNGTLSDGSLTMLGGLGSNMMNRLSVDDTRIPTSTFLGTTPEPLPVDRNAPGALFGLSAQGGEFCELVSSQAVYVAQLTT
jgi:hypothetical protein